VSRRTLSAYHRRAYAGEQVVLAAAGNLRHEGLVELLEERRNGVALGGGLPPRKSVVGLRRPGLRFQAKETEQYHVCLGAPGIARMDERRFAASILDAIVGGSVSSRLFQEIREKRGMAYSVYSYASQYADAGQIGLYVGTREENLSTCLEIAVSELADVASGNVRSDELSRAKENLKGRLLLSLESTSNRMTRLGKATITETPLLRVDEIVKRLESVSAGEVAELADELLAPERLSAAGIGPDEGRFQEAVARVNPALLEKVA
jgi:predicted Zn-dependent peptidase